MANEETPQAGPIDDGPIDQAPIDQAQIDQDGQARAGRSPWRRAAQVAGWVIAVPLAILALALAFLHTAPGRQMLVDQIAAFSPASGLSVEVGRIEGSVLWSATFKDVQLRDADDVLFLEVPAIDLSWRPLNFLFGTLDVRHLVLREGTLYAAPKLRPGDPDAPILPGFDIRVDRFVIEDLRVAEGLAGAERMIDFSARASVRSGLVRLDAGGELGEGDAFSLLVHAEPDGDRFDLDLDWRAPAGGLLAAMVGAQDDLLVQLKGDGTWTSWEGQLLAEQAGTQLLEFTLGNQGGRYSLAGRARPGGYVEGMVAQALGEQIILTASGTLENSVVEGDFVLRASGLNADGAGAIDLANNRFDQFSLAAQLLDPALFSPDFTLRNAQVAGVLDGPFSDLSVTHLLQIGLLDAAGTPVRAIRQQGTLAWDGTTLQLPLDVRIGQITTGNAIIDPRLVNGRVGGTLTYSGNQLESRSLAMEFAGLRARLSLATNLDSGLTRLAGPVEASAVPLEGIGALDAAADIRLAFGGSAPWSLAAQADGLLALIEDGGLAGIAGQNLAFAGGITLGGDQPLVIEQLQLESDKLEATLAGQLEEGQSELAGSGSHADYGPFEFAATLTEDGPSGTLALASPLPAAGLADVRLALAPAEAGFAIDVSGQSLLGPFAGQVDLALPEEGDIVIGVTRLDVAETRVAGSLRLLEQGISGALTLARGGVNGEIAFDPTEAGQGFGVDLALRDARFTGETPISIARGTIAADGVFGDAGASLSGNLALQGVSYGGLFLGRVAARGTLADGSGTFDAALTGQRGSRFDLRLNGQFAPERIALAAEGSYAGRALTMPRPAVLLAREDGGWELERSQISYDGGFAIASGQFGGEGPLSVRLALARLPLALASALGDDLGLGGTISGVVEFNGGEAGGLPVGDASLTISGLTRSSALLTSQPLDIALVAQLSADLAQGRAVLSDGRGTQGRMQARIANMPEAGGVAERLLAGDLRASARVEGSAAALWRLAAIDLLDLTGTIRLAADVRGTLAHPRLNGSLAGDDLRVQSAVTGTDLRQVSARGRFIGSRIEFSRFAGEAPNGGQVSGSGFVDLTSMTPERGPQIDIRLAARNAQLLDLPMMGATITGPMRIVSDGVGGTVAGRLQVGSARWRLGGAEEMAELPVVEVREINLPADSRPLAADPAPWRFLIDATAPAGIMVDGLGLDSQWRGDIRLRGTTLDPRIGGAVEIVPRQGFYSFAGVRFDLTRGRIGFDETGPINPQVDIVAESDINSINVAVNIEGEAMNPQITFSSTPALPEEELLAQMLFGGSVANLSATDALQLGAALASLRGGSGLGPINQLRDAIGVDRLRLIAADPALGRGASVAIGKNISRRLYAEIITDGAGYNATDLEFRITGWLSLLGTVNTIGRDSIGVIYNRDY